MANKKKKRQAQANARRIAIAQEAATKARSAQTKQSQEDPRFAVAPAPDPEPVPSAEEAAPAQPDETAPQPSSHAVAQLAGEGARPEISKSTARRRLAKLGRFKMTRGNLAAAVVTLAIGVALVAQVQNTQAGDLENLREADLVALLDDVSDRADALEDEVQQLEKDKAQLEGSDGADAAAAAAAQRLESYQILAGTVPVSGEGVTITVIDPDGELTTTTMIDLIQELRDAGSEAIQIGPARVVASSWFGVAEGQLTVDGITLDQPYTVTAIGDSHTLAGALAIPGGFNDSVRRNDGDVVIEESDVVTITATTQPREMQYAEPVPATDGR